MREVERRSLAGRVTSSNPLLTLVQDAWLSRIILFSAISLLASPFDAEGQTTILSSIPANGATEVIGDAPVVFTFSTNMNTAGTFAFFFATTSLVLVSPSWSADGTRMTNTPASSFPGGATINWMVMGQSAVGDMLGGTTTGSFTTGSGGPTLASVVPTNGSVNVSLTEPVIFSFSTSLNKAASQARFYTTLGSAVTMTAAWNVEGTRLTNTPAPAFPANNHITWLMTGQDTLGRTLSGWVNGNFMTGNGGSTTPSLVSTSPTHDAINVQPSTPVYFIFSEAMNANLTTVQFHESTAPTQPLPVASVWSGDREMLMCTPNSAFPGGKVIVWTVQGQAATGADLAGATGSFTTTDSGSGPIVLSALLSRGELVEQVDTSLFQTSGQEFQALAGKDEARTLAIARPSLVINVLSSPGTVQAMEFSDTDVDAISFATNYLAGVYQFLIHAADSDSTSAVGLSDGLLPAAPRLLNWQNPPRLALGQPLALQWNWDAGGASVDYVRVRIEQGGRVVFASPLPDSPGALNAASNNVVVPAGVFTTAGMAEVSMSAFSFTDLNTNSIPGLTLHAARHRTTTIKLRVVDGATPPPTLRSTNLAGFAVGEPYLFVLRTTNGARPIQFSLLDGALPPGLMLDSQGALLGQASGAGTFDARVRLTDLLGQSTTQSLRVVTAQLPLFATPWLENIRRGASSTVRFDLVGGAGADCVIERSTNLVDWITHVTTSSPLNRLTLEVPIAGSSMYFRARGLNQSLPHTPNPRTVVPILNPSVTTSAELNWQGGSLSLTNAAGYVFALNVPPGALRRPEMITLTEIAQVQRLPFSGGMRAAVDLKPEGLTFQVPARLDITAPTALDPRASIAFGALADGSQFTLRPSFITNSTVSQFLRHFSSAGVGDGTAGDAQSQAQGFPPDDPNSSAEQDAASEMQRCRADPDCDTNSEEAEARLSQIYIRMADQVILPALKAASGGASDDALDQALFKWRDWAAQITSLGLVLELDGGIAPGELADRMRRATALASDGIVNGINRACDQCRQHDLQRIGRVLRLARLGELLGFGSESQWVECVKQCLVYKLKIEAEITATTSSGTFRTKTKSEPKLSFANDSGEKFGESFTGSGSWQVEECEPIDSKCPTTVSPTSGSARIPTVLVDLFQERLIEIPGVGKLIVYTYDPTLWVALGAELSGTPADTWTLHCEDVPPQTIDRLFGPAFLAMHADETGSDQTGSMVFWLRDFDVGSGEKMFTKDYEREQATSKGPVREKTHIELLHTPK